MARPQKALVVDDLAVNRLILGTILQKLGFEVLEAENGLQCIDVYNQERTQLVCIFLDLQMPVADGWAATKGIRDLESQTANAEHIRVPVVVCTASCLDDVVENGQTVAQHALSLGADGAVRKPLTTNAVERILDEYAPQWRTSRSGDEPSPVDPRCSGSRPATATAPSTVSGVQAAPGPLLPQRVATAASAPAVHPVAAVSTEHLRPCLVTASGCPARHASLQPTAQQHNCQSQQQQPQQRQADNIATQQQLQQQQLQRRRQQQQQQQLDLLSPVWQAYLLTPCPQPHPSEDTFMSDAMPWTYHQRTVNQQPYSRCGAQPPAGARNQQQQHCDDDSWELQVHVLPREGGSSAPSPSPSWRRPSPPASLFTSAAGMQTAGATGATQAGSAAFGGIGSWCATTAKMALAGGAAQSTRDLMGCRRAWWGGLDGSAGVIGGPSDAMLSIRRLRPRSTSCDVAAWMARPASPPVLQPQKVPVAAAAQ